MGGGTWAEPPSTEVNSIQDPRVTIKTPAVDSKCCLWPLSFSSPTSGIGRSNNVDDINMNFHFLVLFHFVLRIYHIAKKLIIIIIIDNIEVLQHANTCGK